MTDKEYRKKNKGRVDPWMIGRYLKWYLLKRTCKDKKVIEKID